MDLFIETPKQASERLERERRSQEAWLKALQQQYDEARLRAARDAALQDAPRAGQEAPYEGRAQKQPPPVAHPGRQSGCGEPAGERVSNPASAGEAPAASRSGEYTVAQDAYRKEIAFDKRRARRRKAFAVVRFAALIVGIPVLLGVVFVGSYVCTCVLNGATPSEVGELLAGMASRIASFFAQIE